NVIAGLVGGGGGSLTALKNTLSSIGSSNIGGTGGIGGLVEKIKGLGGAASGSISGIGGLTAALGPLALGLGAAALAYEAYREGMENVAKAKHEQELAKNAKFLSDQIDHLTKSFDDLKITPDKGPAQLLATLGPIPGIINKAVDAGKQDAIQTAKNTAESEKLVKAKQALAVAETNYQNAPRKDKEHTKDVRDAAAAEVTRLQKIEDTIPANEKLTAQYKAQHPELAKVAETSGEVNDALVKMGQTLTINSDTWSSLGPGLMANVQSLGLLRSDTEKSVGVVQGFGTHVDELRTKFENLNKTPLKIAFPTADAAKFDNYIMNWGSQVPKLAAVGKSFSDMVKHAQESATAGLQLNQVFATMGQTLTPFQSLMSRLSTDEQGWVTQTQASIAAENTH